MTTAVALAMNVSPREPPVIVGSPRPSRLRSTGGSRWISKPRRTGPREVTGRPSPSWCTRSSNPLYAVAHRILRDTGLAEDALQNALVLAWRRLPELRDPDRFEAWLQRLLVNACYDESRRAA